jgi:hypothetical protein
MFEACLAAAWLALAAATHEEQNPVYQDLLAAGVTAGEQSRKLPAPTLPDGLSAQAQVDAIKTLGGARYSFDRLTRKSVVAPQIIRVPDASAEAKTPLRTVDVWFVAHAELDDVADEEFLGKLLTTNQSDGASTELTPEQLSACGIAPASVDPEHEGYDHIAYTLLDKVRISATGRSFWSRTDDSIVAAVKVDPRFSGDAKLPNRWTLVDNPDAPLTPYEGMGFYAKITRMKEPSGALFIEFHLVFAEPVEWFRGTNQLGAKLPAVVQSQVREARRQMMLAVKSGGQ